MALTVKNNESERTCVSARYKSKQSRLISIVYIADSQRMPKYDMHIWDCALTSNLNCFHGLVSDQVGVIQ